MSNNVGRFTGDVLSSGYNLGRNSSRVINPPGGKTSDIFGTGPPAVAQNNHAHAAAHSKRNESSVFRSPAKSQAPAEAHTTAAARRGNSTVFSHCEASPAKESTNVMGAYERPNAAQSPQRRVIPEQQFGRSEQVKSRDVHTSSRVLAPPGGRCHNIFG
eukprot:m.334586 g.334586  ORF g.334586 m.334586 type:complete len:159 (-) comp17390_c0_seq1:176-652(-)